MWNLFRADFPKVEEQPPLAPAFETFGLPTIGRQRIGLIREASSHDRFWFVRQDGAELIQFQQDRLLHNWRKVGDESNEYPRFESMVTRFRGELCQLQDYVNRLSPQTLAINQCEISYINQIAANSGETLIAANWLRFMSFGDPEPDDFKAGFREVLRDSEARPFGRFYCDASVGVKTDGQQVIVLTLTVRGAPMGQDIDSSLEFLAMGRDQIVRKFTDLTTDKAHQKWERAK